MRDLVIWTIALRLAREGAGAILISRDEVHAHQRGALEADAAKLHRAKTFDEALDLLGAVSPTGALARSVLFKIWNDLKSAGLPVPEEVPSGRFSRLLFVAGQEGHANTNLNFELPIGEGPLIGSAHIFQVSPGIIKVDLTGVQIGAQQWRTGRLSITVLGELPKITHPLADRIIELRNLIEGRQ
jgi:hypothetical protein